ncbi:MAG: two-component regulator propeller domain-containing protein, partial [Ferruginibacter sp.]
MKKIFFYTLLILLSKGSFAQSFNAPLRFTNYTVANGLPSNKVNDIIEDSRGFVWMGTAQGLVRFDGNKFIVYNHSRADSNSMPFDDVQNCIVLNNHELVFECNGKMWMLNPLNGKQHPPPSFWNSKTEARLKKINNHLIVVKSLDKFYFTDFDLRIIDSIDIPVLKGFFERFYLGDNRVLFSDNHRMLCYSLNSKKMEEWEFDKASFVTDLYVKDADTINKRIFIGGYGSGVYTMSYDISAPDYLKGLKQPFPFISAVSDISYKKDAIIILSNYSLTIKQAGKSAILLQHIYGEPASLLPGVLNKVFAGSDGQYWIAGDNGVSHFNLNQINYKYWKLPFQAIINHYNKNSDKIWMSSEQYGSMAINTKTNSLQITDSSIIRYCWGAVPVNNLIYLHGNSTMGSYEKGEKNVKLLAYNSITNKISTPTFIKPFLHGAELITLVYQSKNGDVWYSINEGNGLVRQEAGSNNFTQYRTKDIPSPFPFRYLNKAAEDKNADIYFTVNYSNKILVWRNKNQHFETWGMDSLLGNKNMHFGPIFNHIIDSRQNLWVMYPQTGLVKYSLETKKGKLYETEDGLPYNSFDNLVADTNDNIWFPTPKGLCCLLAATDKFIIFTEKDGLPFTDFSNCYLFFDKDDTTLYFSSLGYLYNINTTNLLSRKKETGSKLFIEAMQVNAKPYYFEDEKNIQLAATENNLFFSFELLDLAQNIQQKNIEYLLLRNNQQGEWQKLNGTNSVAFTAMQPGSYTLQVRLLNEATGKNIPGSNPFTFTIATPWNKSWWFITLVLLAILLV